MRILAIETSCDETAVCLLETHSGDHFAALGNTLLSQIDVHREFGGVYPNLAKREHAKNLVPLLEQTLREAGALSPTEGEQQLAQEDVGELKVLLEREPELFSRLLLFLAQVKKPDIDLIAVTSGPGLEPALWVGINFAKALSRVWGIPIVPVNHMEGHILAALLQDQSESSNLQSQILEIAKVQFPVLALLVSGGHTELVLAESWKEYQVVGETRDDAVGEAFDKVARMLDLPYPGGPEISRLADRAREANLPPIDPLPRPMLDSDNLDFSFSGLKTAVLYRIRQLGSETSKLAENEKEALTREFEDAAVDVLIEKTRRALEETGAKTLVIGGGVSANTTLRDRFEALMYEYKGVTLYIPERSLTTDNAIMIGIAGYMHKDQTAQPETITAEGHVRLSR